MREILFRAKTIGDEPKWVEGYYTKRDFYYITGFTTNVSVIYDEGGNWDEINPETLCQFTGICDKNAERVFEGDIVQLSFSFTNKHIYSTIGKIIWHESCAFICEILSNKGENYPLSPECEYEVIGNIYDNPELLGKVK